MISQPCTVQRSTSSCHKLSARSSSYPQSPTCFCLKSIVSTAHVGFLVTRAHVDGLSNFSHCDDVDDQLAEEHSSDQCKRQDKQQRWRVKPAQQGSRADGRGRAQPDSGSQADRNRLARRGACDLVLLRISAHTSIMQWARPRNSDDIKNPDSYYGRAQPEITIQETDSAFDRRHNGIV